jgi:hypothetical protein
MKKEDGDDNPADFNDYLKIFLRRDAIIGIMNEPYFADYVTGCFVRYSVGDAGGKAVYRFCEILAVEHDERPYKIPSPNGNGSIETSVRFKLSTSGVVREKAKLLLVSNHTVTQDELELHLKGLLEKKRQPLTKWDIKVIRAKQKKYKNHTYNVTEIAQMVSKKVGLNNVLATEYSTAMEILHKKMEEARAAKDFKKLEEVQKTIEKLEQVNAKQRENFEKTAKAGVEINRKMKENNMLRDMKAGMRKRQEDQEALARGILSNAVTDPFIRRETRPKVLWKSQNKLAEQAGEEDAAKKAPQQQPPQPQQAAASTAVSTATAAPSSNKHANNNKSLDDDIVIGSVMTIEEISARLKQRVGVDFLSEFYKSKKDK